MTLGVHGTAMQAAAQLAGQRRSAVIDDGLAPKRAIT